MMKPFLIISLFAALLFSCTKLTEKNIRGNWKITSQTLLGQDVTVSQYSAVWTFNEAPNCLYTLDWKVSDSLFYSYNLDKKNQKLTITNFIVRVDIDTLGVTLNYIPSVTFDVEKNGKKMILRSPGDTIVCHLELLYPDY
ncbi:MAG: hypothetical protein R2799_09850 [Crocinitomicaceae bacterium]